MRRGSETALLPALMLLAACSLACQPRRTAPPHPPHVQSEPAVLWQDPGSMRERDPFWGFGDPSRAPQGPFTFVEEDMGGTQPKVAVEDRGGRRWEVKFGIEVPAEIASNRFLWLLGYLGEEMYFVPDGVIRGIRRLERARRHLRADGAFVRARFRRADPRASRTEERWSFARNPFVGRRELSGLIVAMNLINNWDIRTDRNNRVLRVKRPDGTLERWFVVSDLGATFGGMGGRFSRRSKWNLKDYVEEDFVEAVSATELRLDYEGFGNDALDRVPLAHARWFAGIASEVTVEQLRRIFEAAGATRSEIDGYSTRLSAKIAELNDAVR